MSLELNRFNGDADNQPNPCLGYIEKPPFVAVDVWAAEIGCSIGLKTNINGQVLNQEDKEIVGMYACGNDMSSIMAGCYPGLGSYTHLRTHENALELVCRLPLEEKKLVEALADPLVHL